MQSLGGEPSGFVYAEAFLNEAEERALLALVSSMRFESYVMRGRASKRGVRHFGLRYDYRSRELQTTEPIPSGLRDQIERAEEFASLEKGSIVEALVNHYPPGAGVGWHNDASVYRTIVGISLGSSCSIQFKTGEGKQQIRTQTCLLPRSVYLMRGLARDEWQHRIPPTKAERFSLTLRSLTEGSQ